MCHMSHVTCHLSHVNFIFILFFGQIVGASRWRVCYQRGLPRLVSNLIVLRNLKDIYCIVRTKRQFFVLLIYKITVNFCVRQGKGFLMFSQCVLSLSL